MTEQEQKREDDLIAAWIRSVRSARTRPKSAPPTKAPNPDVDNMQLILDGHCAVEVHLRAASDTPTLYGVKLNQYRVLVQDLNRKVEEVRAFQVRAEHASAMHGLDFDAMIRSLFL